MLREWRKNTTLAEEYNTIILLDPASSSMLKNLLGYLNDSPGLLVGAYQSNTKVKNVLRNEKKYIQQE